MQNNFYHPQMKFRGKVIFSQACVKNSVHRGVPALGGLLPGSCLLRGVCSGGVSAPGGVCSLGGWVGAWSWGGAWWRPPNGYCCGWYASYRNAFLFKVCTIWAVSTVNFYKSLFIREVTSL